LCSSGCPASRGFLPRGLSDAGPGGCGELRHGPASESLHKSRKDDWLDQGASTMAAYRIAKRKYSLGALHFAWARRRHPPRANALGGPRG
jgi:hypothetical protein